MMTGFSVLRSRLTGALITPDDTGYSQRNNAPESDWPGGGAVAGASRICASKGPP
jgi:hypothetical protein